MPLFFICFTQFARLFGFSKYSKFLIVLQHLLCLYMKYFIIFLLACSLLFSFASEAYTTKVYYTKKGLVTHETNEAFSYKAYTIEGNGYKLEYFKQDGDSLPLAAQHTFTQIRS